VSTVETDHQQLLLDTFHRVAADMEWYRELLRESGVTPEQVVDGDSFSRLCPILTKQNTFDRFPMHQLSGGIHPSELASVLTSSGHGGRFSFGLSTRKQAAKSGSFVDLVLDAAFGVKSHLTLAINCLPMGVGFTSECMTVATTSVREDMVVALLRAFGSYYEQIVLVADPLFMKRLTDYAAEHGVDWQHYRPSVVLGEEIFGEYFRDYVGSCLGINPDRWDSASIMSSFGVGELGLHLCYETRTTIALRRALWRNADLARELLGPREGKTLPMILAFNPCRTFIEIDEPDSTGFGRMTISLLESENPLPLLRYQSGDVARLLSPILVAETLRRHGAVLPHLPAHFLALEGRVREALPNGAHIGIYKDALYADQDVARKLSGAFRVQMVDGGCMLHVQMGNGQVPTEEIECALLQAIPEPVRPVRLVCWPYDRFPFGMTIDYERKFSYYVP
jgi:phenylacetate-CoA ligase